MAAELVRGEFVVRVASALTGVGTVAFGYFRWGTGHTGDRVEWSPDGTPVTSRLKGLWTACELPMRDPPSIGLNLSTVLPDDLQEGAVLTVYGDSA